MNAAQIERLAELVDDAARDARSIAQLTQTLPFGLEDAYRIQRRSMARRARRGERCVGIKLGFTSRAKMVQMGVSSLIWGWLSNEMLEEEGGEVKLSRYIHPRAEPEVCFLTKRAIDGPLTALEAAQVVEAVAPAIEIIDSRYRDFRFSLEDVVADNCSSAGLVVGTWTRRFAGLDDAGVVLRVDGRPVQMGHTAAILGHPIRALVQASRLLADAQIALPAGSLIMAGAATAAVALAPGQHLEAQLGADGTGLGRVGFGTQAMRAAA